MWLRCEMIIPTLVPLSYANVLNKLVLGWQEWTLSTTSWRLALCCLAGIAAWCSVGRRYNGGEFRPPPAPIASFQQ